MLGIVAALLVALGLFPSRGDVRPVEAALVAAAGVLSAVLALAGTRWLHVQARLDEARIASLERPTQPRGPFARSYEVVQRVAGWAEHLRAGTVAPGQDVSGFGVVAPPLGPEAPPEADPAMKMSQARRVIMQEGLLVLDDQPGRPTLTCRLTVLRRQMGQGDHVRADVNCTFAAPQESTVSIDGWEAELILRQRGTELPALWATVTGRTATWIVASEPAVAALSQSLPDLAVRLHRPA